MNEYCSPLLPPQSPGWRKPDFEWCNETLGVLSTSRAAKEEWVGCKPYCQLLRVRNASSPPPRGRCCEPLFARLCCPRVLLPCHAGMHPPSRLPCMSTCACDVKGWVLSRLEWENIEETDQRVLHCCLSDGMGGDSKKCLNRTLKYTHSPAAAPALQRNRS